MHRFRFGHRSDFRCKAFHELRRYLRLYHFRQIRFFRLGGSFRLDGFHWLRHDFRRRLPGRFCLRFRSNILRGNLRLRLDCHFRLCRKILRQFRRNRNVRLFYRRRAQLSRSRKGFLRLRRDFGGRLVNRFRFRCIRGFRFRFGHMRRCVKLCFAQPVFAVARLADDGDLLPENGNLICHNLGFGAVQRDDLDFLHQAFPTDENFRDLAVDGAGLGNRLRADNADIRVKHGLEIAGFLKRQDTFAARNGNGVFADGNHGGIGQQLHASIPVLILDGNRRHRALSRVNHKRLADAQLTSFGDADNGQPQDFHALFCHGCLLLLNVYFYRALLLHYLQ